MAPTSWKKVGRAAHRVNMLAVDWNREYRWPGPPNRWWLWARVDIGIFAGWNARRRGPQRNMLGGLRVGGAHACGEVESLGWAAGVEGPAFT